MSQVRWGVPQPQPGTQPPSQIFLPAPVSGTSYVDAMSGTITFTGSAVETHAHVGSGSGTFTFTGTRTETNAHIGAGSGTLTFTGSSTETHGHTAAGSGSFTFTGSASESSSTDTPTDSVFASLLHIMRLRRTN